MISPTLSNIFLHHVLDVWFEQEVTPRLRGRCQLVRYCDDFVIAFEDRQDGKRVLDVLGKRLGRYGLTLHDDKTYYVDFRPSRPQGRHPATTATTFDFLGFTHVWGKSRRGYNIVRQVTAKGRFARAVKAVGAWCRKHRHLPIAVQQKYLARVIRGHCAYYGLTGNSKRLGAFRYQVTRTWRKWLSRRSRTGKVNWDRMTEILFRYPLPPARVVRTIHAT